MTRILITGAASGLGLGAARELARAGHTVLAHARSDARIDQACREGLDGAVPIVGDLATMAGLSRVIRAVDDAGGVDAIIANAGVLDGPDLLAINVIAPYVLLASLPHERSIVLSSSMHRGGAARIDAVGGQGAASYSDSKLLVTMLAAAVARRGAWSHAVDPGWVPTRMGGRGAPDDLVLGHRTQAWLAVEDASADSPFAYWHHQRQYAPHPAVLNEMLQDELLDALATRTGVDFSPRE
ncbi:SDR family NAD(P)-dependent oxidoreductase [Microbacterium excoecariae]|uniref:SDR family NAD(P)-dependent oxidoreductase n=1 Tax=Microbacterium excoecariae TaxID=2715210 RepID=UPI0014097D93|nr:SDR family NAD(P)-dependent oxidoreductase [Microbacterium excoecariae]NHI17533.1 SDR family NAD(P)-dependent oxidoreductase [Microbacterium excoecariae]